VLDWGGDGEPVVLLHPNGFCAGLFEPIVQRLGGGVRAVAIDLRGHGGTSAPPSGDGDGYAFDRMAADVVAVIEHLGLGSVLILGQSLGGGVGTLVDRARPGIVRRLLLCEAIAFSPPAMAPGARRDNPMAAGARRRRAVWPDRETMVGSYGSRPPLNELAPEALEAYVRWGTVERPDGTVELACDPEVEATIFERSASPRGAPLAWAHLAHLQADAVVVAGDRSDLPTEWFAAQAERAAAPFVQLGGGHFFLQEDSDRAATLVREHLLRV
jgi:pimeloyl-ACP methyl ester carboxylesterase